MARSTKNLRDIVIESRLSSDVNVFNFETFENDLKICNDVSSSRDVLKLKHDKTSAKMYNSIFDLKNDLLPKNKSESKDFGNRYSPRAGNKNIKLLRNKTNDNLKILQIFLNKENNFCDFCHFWLSVFKKEERRKFFNKKSEEVLKELDSTSTNYTDLNKQHLTSFINEYFDENKTNNKDNFPPNPKQCSSIHYTQLKHITTLSSHDVYWNDKTYIQALKDFTIVFIWKEFMEEFKRHTPNIKRKKKRLREKKMSEIEKKLYEIEKSYGAYSSDEEEDVYNPLNDSKSSKISNQIESNLNRIMAAISKNQSDVVDFMIDTNIVDLQYKDSNDKNLLLHCVILNRPSVMQCLINKAQQRGELSSFINNKSNSGNSALHACVNTNNQDCLKILLSTPHIHIDAPNLLCGGATPLHLAIMHGRASLAAMLLEAGADPTKGMQDKSMEELITSFSPPSSITSIIKQYSERFKS